MFRTFSLKTGVCPHIEDDKHVIYNAGNGKVIIRDPLEYKVVGLTREEARELMIILKEIYSQSPPNRGSEA